MLDAFPLPKQQAEARERLLKVTAAGDRGKILTARIARRSVQGIPIERLVTETGWSPNIIRVELEAPMQSGAIAKLGNHFLDSAAMTACRASLLSALESFQTQNPLSPGMNHQTLREKFALDPDVFSAVVAMLVKEGKVETVGDVIHLRGRGVVMKDEEADSRRIIEQAFASAGLKVPALKDVLASLKIDKARAQKLVTLLLRDKVLIKVSEELVFHQAALNELRKKLAAQKARSPKIDVGRFKDITGVSRKYAIPLLEYLDRERVTRRVGDERVIL